MHPIRFRTVFRAVLVALFGATLLPAQPVDTFRVVDSVLEIDESRTVSVQLTNATMFQGWSYGVCIDPSLITIDDVEQGTALAVQDPEFYSTNIFGDGFTVGVVWFGGATYMPPGDAQEIDRVLSRAKVAGPETTEMVFCETLGSPTVPIQAVDVTGSPVPLETVSGVIHIGVIFARGDVDGDGIYTVSDPIRALDGIFAAGAPLECPDAADTDDDGALTLVDPILLLSALFQMGTPPAAPYPQCGPDPTDDDLDCNTVPDCS